MANQLTAAQVERIRRLGLNPNDFAPAEDQPTIADIVEALDILISIFLEDDDD